MGDTAHNGWSQSTTLIESGHECNTPKYQSPTPTIYQCHQSCLSIGTKVKEFPFNMAGWRRPLPKGLTLVPSTLKPLVKQSREIS